MKWIITRQLPDSPPLQQGASDPISGLTGLLKKKKKEKKNVMPP